MTDGSPPPWLKRACGPTRVGWLFWAGWLAGAKNAVTGAALRACPPGSRPRLLRADITRADVTERGSTEALIGIVGPIQSCSQSARLARQLDPTRSHRDAPTR
jgi:hypothetical protein